MTTPIVVGGGASLAFRKVGLMMVPEEYIALELPCNFANDPAQVLSKDFTQECQRLQIPFIQSVYIDNSGDANPLTLQIQGTAFSITVKGHTQGFYPLPCGDGPQTFIITSTASIITKTLTFFSMVVPFVNWATQ